MILLGLGILALGFLLWTAGAFSRAKVATLKMLLAWVAALAGLALGAMLLLTGRGATAIGAAVLLGPLAWSWWQQAQAEDRTGGRQRSKPWTSKPGKMSRTEALEVLDLTDPVSDADVRAAWVQLMRVAHPDGGGSHGLAARVNQARDVLLKGG